MPVLSERDIGQMSDLMKRSALKRAAPEVAKLPETEIAGWFVNLSDGPQFFLGGITAPNGSRLQPLFYAPATPDQQPVAWRWGTMITACTDLYRDDIEWRPLYPAR